MPIAVTWAPFLAAGLSSHGLRTGHLSPSGAAAAFAMTYMMVSVHLDAFGNTFMMFYLAGYRATIVGQESKQTLKQRRKGAGDRNAFQVLCTSVPAAIAALLWSATYEPRSWASTVFDAVGMNLSPKVPYDFEQWCPLTPAPNASWSRKLIFVMLGHFSCCLGDTLASELGILSRSPPILVTTRKPVPRGTNGGVSTMGTLFSCAGGLLIGTTTMCSLLSQSSACQRDWVYVAFPLALGGTVAGFFGSLLDSAINAILQRTRYDMKRISTDEGDITALSANANLQVTTGRNILTNDQVNLISSIITAAILGSIA